MDLVNDTTSGFFYVFSGVFTYFRLGLVKKGQGCLARIEKESPQALEIGENTCENTLKTLYGVIDKVQNYIYTVRFLL